MDLPGRTKGSAAVFTPAAKRKRASGDFSRAHPARDQWHAMEGFGESSGHEDTPAAEGVGPVDYGNEAFSDLRASKALPTKMAEVTVAPFLARHIPEQYAPLGNQDQPRRQQEKDSNTKYCYRHHPDLKCKRQADEPSMEQLQQQLETLSQGDQQAITHVWAVFSAAPSKHRNLMLRGILAQCCFSQLSYLSAAVRELVRIDFMTALPPELSFQILSYLDTASLCKAAQVSRRWRTLADDDVVWHRMCEQHIDRKCTKCGCGLPLLEQKRLRATKRQIQLRATGLGVVRSPRVMTPRSDLMDSLGMTGDDEPRSDRGSHEPPSSTSTVKGKRLWREDGEAQVQVKRARALLETPGRERPGSSPRARPWKDVYRDRFKVCTNWRYGRCSIKVFRGHTNGVMCLQFDDSMLATGSYDATIKIWDIRTGKELRTLTGHESGVRALQFDDRKLISGSLDRSLKIWNWRTGECISTYHGHSGGVISVHFEAHLLASGSMDKTIKIWNFEDKSTFLLRGHTDWVNEVKIDIVSCTLFSASDDCTVRLWDLQSKTCLRIFEGHVGQVQQVRPLPREFEYEDAGRSSFAWPREGSRSPGAPGSDGDDDDRPDPPRYMLTGALDSTVRLWDVVRGECLRTFFGHVEGVWALAADTVRIVSGAQDGMVKIWDARSGKCERTFTGHAGPVTCIGLSDTRMCTGSEDCEVRLYSFRSETSTPEELDDAVSMGTDASADLSS